MEHYNLQQNCVVLGVAFRAVCAREYNFLLALNWMKTLCVVEVLRARLSPANGLLEWRRTFVRTLLCNFRAVIKTHECSFKSKEQLKQWAHKFGPDDTTAMPPDMLSASWCCFGSEIEAKTWICGFCDKRATHFEQPQIRELWLSLSIWNESVVVCWDEHRR